MDFHREFPAGERGGKHILNTSLSLAPNGLHQVGCRRNPAHVIVLEDRVLVKHKSLTRSTLKSVGKMRWYHEVNALVL